MVGVIVIWGNWTGVWELLSRADGVFESFR